MVFHEGPGLQVYLQEEVEEVLGLPFPERPRLILGEVVGDMEVVGVALGVDILEGLEEPGCHEAPSLHLHYIEALAAGPQDPEALEHRLEHLGVAPLEAGPLVAAPLEADHIEALEDRRAQL